MARQPLAVHTCQKELDPVHKAFGNGHDLFLGGHAFKYSEEELMKCLNKDEKDDESEKMTDGEWAQRALEQFQQELDQGV